MIDLQRKICKPVLKLDFTARGILESLSEFGLCMVSQDITDNRKTDRYTEDRDWPGLAHHLVWQRRARICKRLCSLGIDSTSLLNGGLIRQSYIVWQNRIPWNRFLGSLNVYKFGFRTKHIKRENRRTRQNPHKKSNRFCIIT